MLFCVFKPAGRSAAAASAVSLWILAGAAGSAAEARYQPRTGWDEYTNGVLNISVYVFRDINRNGVYDLGDRPMSGIAVDAVGNHKTETGVSNQAGFANFRMSASDREMEITFPGRYVFDTDVPPGWRLSTGNELQEVDFELRPGAPADLVAVPAPLPVGLVPDLSISGRVARNAQGELLATSAAGDKIAVATDMEGRYEFAARPGEWRLELVEDGVVTAERRVTIATAPAVLSGLASLGPVRHGKAGSQTVTFDDLQSEGVLKIPSGYGGLNWNNFVMTHQKVYSTAGYRNNIMSGEFLAYNGSGHPASISANRPFDFVGGYFGASTLEAEGLMLNVKAWRGDQLAYEESLVLSALGPIYFAADFVGVTRIDFETGHFWQFTVDDLAFGFAE